MINNLFILGNGFDIGHGMKSSYNDFKLYLINTYPGIQNIDFINISDIQTSPDGDVYIPDKDLASFLYSCIDETGVDDEWNSFETTLGKINWKDICDSNTYDVYDKDDNEINYFKTAYVREDFTYTLYFNSLSFSKLFTDWINTIDYPITAPHHPSITNNKSNSIFMNFNYTRTLEDIYGISTEQIYHIHGVQGEEIIIGHGDNTITNYGFGMEELDQIHQSLKKPTEKIIAKSKFFKRLDSYDITSVYAWGFSFSDVDLCYIKEISKNIDTKNIKWYLHEYDKNNFKGLKKAIKDCGFNGKFYSFNNMFSSQTPI